MTADGRPTAVVSGRGTGIGRAIALRFAADGWRVAVLGRRPEPLEDLARTSRTCPEVGRCATQAPTC